MKKELEKLKEFKEECEKNYEATCISQKQQLKSIARAINVEAKRFNTFDEEEEALLQWAKEFINKN